MEKRVFEVKLNSAKKKSASSTSSFSKTKVSFVFCSTKDLQEILLQNRVFLHTLLLEKEAQVNKINYATMFFMSKPVCPNICTKAFNGNEK